MPRSRSLPGRATARVTALAEDSVRHPPASALSAHGGGSSPADAARRASPRLGGRGRDCGRGGYAGHGASRSGAGHAVRAYRRGACCWFEESGESGAVHVHAPPRPTGGRRVSAQLRVDARAAVRLPAEVARTGEPAPPDGRRAARAADPGGGAVRGAGVPRGRFSAHTLTFSVRSDAKGNHRVVQRCAHRPDRHTVPRTPPGLCPCPRREPSEVPLVEFTDTPPHAAGRASAEAGVRHVRP